MHVPRVPSHIPPGEPFGSFLPSHHPCKKPEHPLSILQFARVIHPRKPRQRTMLLVFMCLVLLTAYVYLVHCLDAGALLVLRGPDVKTGPNQLSLALESIHKSDIVPKTPSKAAVEGIQLTSTQELAAVSGFLASLPQNQLPSLVDPSNPINPQLVLDFDARNPRASQEVNAMVDDVWSRNPVFLYSKRYSSASREVKAILEDLNLKPSVTVIDVDARDDASVLVPMLHRLTSFDDFPILIIAGKPVGTIQDIHRMNQDGTLRQMILQSGALIDGAAKKRRKY